MRYDREIEKRKERRKREKRRRKRVILVAGRGAVYGGYNL